MKRFLLFLVGLTLLGPNVAAQRTAKPAPTPTPKQVQRAQLAALQRLQQTQRNFLLAQARARRAQQTRLQLSRKNPAKRSSGHAPIVVAARPPAPTPKPTPTPSPAPSSKFTGVITTVDLEKNSVTVKRENVEITYTFLPTVSLNFYSGEGNGLKSLTKGTTIDVTSRDGKRADVIVVHDLP